MNPFDRTTAAALHFAPPGHFYSPHPLLEEVEQHHEHWITRSRRAAGLDLNSAGQLARLQQAFASGAVFPWEPQAGGRHRYHTDNPFFRFGDAQALFAMASAFRPAQIVEVGSGYSTACWLDALDALALRAKFHAIEPYPDRVHQLLQPVDLAGRITLELSPVQAVDSAVFTRLQENDVLFIDSTHVSKAGSDLNCLLFEVLPALASGVVVHFHDIFWPFEYPVQWHREGRAWNEAYVLRAFLQFNSAFEFLRFNSYLAREHSAAFSGQDPRFLSDAGGSLWLRRR